MIVNDQFYDYEAFDNLSCDSCENQSDYDECDGDESDDLPIRV